MNLCKMSRGQSPECSRGLAGMADMKILLVDDDYRFLVSTRRAPLLEGVDVETAENAGGALAFLETNWPDVLVLDVAMPGMDGVSFCRLARERYSVPILMLTARDAVADRVAGLDAGADDYLTKPFAFDELMARLRALNRRSGTGQASSPVAYAGIHVDPSAWLATRDGDPLQLTTIEFQLLEAFLRHPEQVLRREVLYETVWSGPDFDDRVLTVHIGNLRRKLEAHGGTRVIHNVRNVGYVLKTAN
jgi:two-component system, OmpR family, response regulator MprA